MKTIRLLIAAGLALAVLAGVALVLAWWRPTIAQAEDAGIAPAAPQALPLPYLSDANTADAPFGFPSSIDGRIAPGEYAGAGKITFRGYGGEVEVFFREDSSNLYVAFDFPDPQTAGSAAQVFLDTNHDGSTTPQPDDYRLSITRSGFAREKRGTGAAWGTTTAPISWTAATTTTLSGWQAEFRIQYDKLGLTAGKFKVMGLSLINAWTAGGDYYWPWGAFWTNPSTWGHLTSSSDWGSFHWKPGPWEDYAPSGVPDFDQMQVGPVYCGPFAAANSLWWFDSKFEQHPAGPQSGILPISDSYTLVSPYGPEDDHDHRNVVSLTVDLGNNYFGTNLLSGTHVYSMYFGLQRYLRDHGLWDNYIVTLVNKPEFLWIIEEVMRSEDVILLLGFWEWVDPDGNPTSGDEHWIRIGGHFVTVAGVDPRNSQVALSDPAQDAAEIFGWPPPSRILSGTLVPHTPIPGHPPTIHNDAGNVSHDVYAVSPGSFSPGGSWWIPGYPVPSFFYGLKPGFNPNPRWAGPVDTYHGGMVHTEIEYALVVSPYTWKASGHWVEDKKVALYNRRFEPYRDFAPSGVPDFDQEQDTWGHFDPSGLNWQWSFCGPVAVANSLWWFDSKFEPNPAPPTTCNDHYPLVNSYATAVPSPWDDHDPLNVEDQTLATQLVDDLASYLDTDGRASGGLHSGTTITDLYAGTIQYIANHGLRQGYVITQVRSPDFWWVAEEVERSEDVILLLGFYVSTGDPGMYERAGGHYVTVPGVEKQNGYIAFSDPFRDRMETILPPNEWTGHSVWTGRVGYDGDPPLGPSGLVPTYTHKITHTGIYTLHNDAANISHDVYSIIPTDSPGGVWGPTGYVMDTGEITNFAGMNGDGSYFSPGLPVQTEVEWAVAVSPVADVWVRKAVTPTVVVPGRRVTFTVDFGNAGHTARNVVISDVLPGGLMNATYTYTLNYTGTLAGHDAYTWTVGTLEWNQGGIITIAARVDPSIRDRQRTITNTVEITTTSQEQYQVPALPNTASAAVTVQTADVAVTKSATPPTLRAGDWLTYTLVYTNYGPAPAASTVITDLLHQWLANAGYSAWSSYVGTAPVPSGRYVWSMGSVPRGGWGIITVTAQVSPSLSGGGTLPNTVSISTATPERDATNNTGSASNTVVYYGVDLQPGSGGTTENPGKTVTYTLTLYNTGNVADTYLITRTVSGRPWTTTWPTLALPVAAGGHTQFNVTVQIPASATSGQWSRAVITATSQGDKSKRDTSVLTTTAYVGTITHHVEVAPQTAIGNGDPAGTVTYTLCVTNTGSVADVIELSHSGPGPWTVAYSTNPLSLRAGLGTDVEVYVGIPSSAPGGSTGVITVTATSQADPTQDDDAVLTTHVGWRFVYLPVVLRNYQ